jgi:hypothetical protein
MDHFTQKLEALATDALGNILTPGEIVANLEAKVAELQADAGADADELEFFEGVLRGFLKKLAGV